MEEKINRLRAEVEVKLPNFVRAMNAPIDTLIMTQDAFAADYQEEEYRLLGMMVKYAGLHGKQVLVIPAKEKP